MKGSGYVTETQVNGKQSKTVETEQYAPIMLLCYCPKEAYVHISNYAFKKGCKNSLHYHALASGEAKKKNCLDLPVRQAMKCVGRHHCSQTEVMGLPLKDGSASSHCFRKSCWNRCDPYHESLFTELGTLLQHRKSFIVCVFIETAMMYINWTKSTPVTVMTRTDQTVHYELHLL